MSFVIVSGGICCSLQYLDSPPPKPVLYRTEPEHVFVANLIYVKYCMYTWPTISSKTIYLFLTWYYKIYTFYDRKFKSDWLIDHIVHMFLGLLINKHVNFSTLYWLGFMQRASYQRLLFPFQKYIYMANFPRIFHFFNQLNGHIYIYIFEKEIERWYEALDASSWQCHLSFHRPWV